MTDEQGVQPGGSPTPPPPVATPAGWYADPHDPGAHRYWDGSQWSEWTDRNYSSKALGGKENPNNDTLAVVGWITAVFLPIVGLVIGIVLNSRDDQRGTWIMVTSAVFIALGLLIVAI